MRKTRVESDIVERLRKCHIRKYNEPLFDDAITEIEKLRETLGRDDKAEIEALRIERADYANAISDRDAEIEELRAFVAKLQSFVAKLAGLSLAPDYVLPDEFVPYCDDSDE